MVSKRDQWQGRVLAVRTVAPPFRAPHAMWLTITMPLRSVNSHTITLALDGRKNELAELELDNLKTPHICCPLRPALGVVPEPTQPFH